MTSLDRSTSRLRALTIALAVAGAALSGCGAEADGEAPLELHVFAASSLTEAFAEMEQAFEAAHPDVDVLLNLAGSQVLRLQIEQGARADVFASANEEHAAALAGAGLAGPAETLAWNALVVIVPADNPASIRAFADLPRAERLVVGHAAVPVGAYTRALLARAGTELGADFASAVRARIVSEESNVRLARAKVELGEADAAIVYRTDAIASERVHAIGIPPALAPRTRYVIAAVGDAAVDVAAGGDGTGARGATSSGSAARAFIAFARSPAGAAILERHGFEGADG